MKTPKILDFLTLLFCVATMACIVTGSALPQLAPSATVRSIPLKPWLSKKPLPWPWSRTPLLWPRPMPSPRRCCKMGDDEP